MVRVVARLSPVVCLAVLAGCTPYRGLGDPSWAGSQAPGVSGVYHQVEPGQTLWRIAKEYGVELETLAAANRWPDAQRLEVGQRLFIPGASQVLAVPPVQPKWLEAPSEQGGVTDGGGEEILWPVQGRVLSFFGARTPHGSNKGVDIQAPEGTAVRVVRSGRVTFLDDHLRGYGKTVIVDHGETLSTVYTHLASITVTVGQSVRQGQILGMVGSTGRAPVPFLHFEIRRRHQPENPFYYLP